MITAAQNARDTPLLWAGARATVRFLSIAVHVAAFSEQAPWAIKDSNGQVLSGFVGSSRIEVGCKVVPARYDAFRLHSGLRLSDGGPLFGPSKTQRGLAVSVIATTLSAPALGMAWTTGLLAALLPWPATSARAS
jgi:hypothetical protein